MLTYCSLVDLDSRGQDSSGVSDPPASRSRRWERGSAEARGFLSFRSICRNRTTVWRKNVEVRMTERHVIWGVRHRTPPQHGHPEWAIVPRWYCMGDVWLWWHGGRVGSHRGCPSSWRCACSDLWHGNAAKPRRSANAYDTPRRWWDHSQDFLDVRWSVSLVVSPGPSDLRRALSSSVVLVCWVQSTDHHPQNFLRSCDLLPFLVLLSQYAQPDAGKGHLLCCHSTAGHCTFLLRRTWRTYPVRFSPYDDLNSKQEPSGPYRLTLTLSNPNAWPLGPESLVLCALGLESNHEQLRAQSSSVGVACRSGLNRHCPFLGQEPCPFLGSNVCQISRTAIDVRLNHPILTESNPKSRFGAGGNFQSSRGFGIHAEKTRECASRSQPFSLYILNAELGYNFFMSSNNHENDMDIYGLFILLF